jgi:hypothetical protein
MKDNKLYDSLHVKISPKSGNFNKMDMDRIADRDNFAYDDERIVDNHRYNKSSFNFARKNKTQSAFFPNFSVSTSLNFNNRRLMGMSEYQSTNSLRNSSHIWSFTKSDRFSGGVYKRAATDTIYKLPDTKSDRWTSQGYGERKDLRPTPGANSPPSNKYNIRSCFEDNLTKKKGPLILDKIPGLVRNIYNIFILLK